MFGRKYAVGEEQGSGLAAFRLICWMLSTVVVLPAAMLVSLHLSFVQRPAIAQFAETIERTTGFQVELSSYSWWPFSRLHIKNITVTSMGKRIVECEELHLTYGISLGYPYLQPKEIHLQKPVIHIERDAAGRWQIPWVSKEDGKDVPGGVPSWWIDMPWPQVRVSGGIIDAQQSGRSVLSIKEINGVLPIRKVSEPNGPKLRIDLGQWGK